MLHRIFEIERTTVEIGLLTHALMGSIAYRALYAYIREGANTIIFETYPVTGCLCDEGRLVN